MTKLDRKACASFLAVMVACSLQLAAASAAPKDSIVRVETKTFDPGLIDVSVATIAFDGETGVVSVLAQVDCFGTDVSVYVVDFEVEQRRGQDIVGAASFTPDAPCGEQFTGTVTPAPGETFQPGPAQVEVHAFACGNGCTVETVRFDVVLLPR